MSKSKMNLDEVLGRICCTAGCRIEKVYDSDPRTIVTQRGESIATDTRRRGGTVSSVNLIGGKREHTFGDFTFIAVSSANRAVRLLVVRADADPEVLSRHFGLSSSKVAV